jgi:hypothetical protein
MPPQTASGERGADQSACRRHPAIDLPRHFAWHQIGGRAAAPLHLQKPPGLARAKQLACVAVAGTTSTSGSSPERTKHDADSRSGGASDAVFAHSNDREASKIWEPNWEPTVTVFRRRQPIASAN